MQYKINFIGSKTAAPVPGAKLVFLDPSGNFIAELETDSNGVIVLDSGFDSDLLETGNEMQIIAPGFVFAKVSTDMLLPETTFTLIEETNTVTPFILGLGIGALLLISKR